MINESQSLSLSQIFGHNSPDNGKDVNLSDQIEFDSSSVISEPSEKMVPLFAEELRQYLYCKRVLYWRRVANVRGMTSSLMDEGQVYHKQRQRYSTLRKEDLIVHRDIYLWDEISNIGARLDLLRERKEGLYVSEFKRYYHNTIFQGHIFQAVLGGIIAERVMNIPFSGIEIQYYPGKRKKFSVTKQMKNDAIKIAKEAKQMISLQILPEATTSISKCKVCEFLKICKNI